MTGVSKRVITPEQREANRQRERNRCLTRPVRSAAS
jgi:hypothetical protein